MKIQFLLSLLLGSTSCNWVAECPEHINLLPMYGNLTKCPEQIEADKIFIGRMNKEFKFDRKKAAEDRIARAWNYFNRNVPDTAMMRFNQAWLLDSLNAETYWGFGSLLGNQQKYQDAIPLFKKSLNLDPSNPIVWASTGQSYGNKYERTEEKKDLDSCIHYFKRSYQLDPSNGRTSSALTIAYVEAMEADSAKKYQILTDKINPQLLPTEIRKKLRKMK